MKFTSAKSFNFNLNGSFGIRGLLGKLADRFGFETGSVDYQLTGEGTLQSEVEMTADELIAVSTAMQVSTDYVIEHMNKYAQATVDTMSTMNQGLIDLVKNDIKVAEELTDENEARGRAKNKAAKAAAKSAKDEAKAAEKAAKAKTTK